MRKTRGTIPVGTIENHPRVPGEKSKSGRERRKAPRPSIKRFYPFDFLNTTFESRRLVNFLSQSFLDLSLSREILSNSISKFLELYCKKVDFTGMGISEIIEKSENAFSELNLEFAVRKKQRDNSIHPYVYLSSHTFDYTILVFYCSPAEHLSEEVSLLYKKFINYVSREMSIPVGLNDDNYYLSAYIDMFLEYDISEDDDEYYLQMSNAVKCYKEGNVRQLLDSIDNINLKRGELKQELEDFLNSHSCLENELVRLMLEGLKYIGNANIYDWAFNEDDDGIYYPDRLNNLSLQSMILYDPNDKVTDMVLEAIDTDYNNGIEIKPWQKGVDISDISKLQDNKDDLDKALISLEEFHNWFTKFYKETEGYYNEQTD